MSFLETFLIDCWLTGDVPGPYRKSQVNTSFALPCSDGKLVAIHLSSPEKFWEGLVAATGHPELATDPRFAERMGRVANYEALRQELNADLRRAPAGVLDSRSSRRHDVPFAPVYNLGEVQHDPQVRHIGQIRESTILPKGRRSS